MSIQRFPEINNNGGGSSGGLQGTWNATTNTPTLANTDIGKVGVMYQVAVGGTVNFGAGSIVFEAKDVVINNGTNWDKIDGSDAVISVNGNTGVVSLDLDDIGDGTTNKAYTATEKTKLSGIATGAQVNTVTSVAGKTGAVTLAKADLGLTNVDNTADTSKPVSTAQQTALDLKFNQSNFIDEDSFATNSAIKAPSQQSVKSYVDGKYIRQTSVDTFGVEETVNRTYTVAGAEPGDAVIINTSVDGDYTVTTNITASNTVKARFANVQGYGTISFTSANIYITIIKQ